MKYFCLASVSLVFVSILNVSCSKETVETNQETERSMRVVEVDPSYFIPEALVGKILKEERTLSDGSKALCYVIQTNSKPIEHAMGPWAPKTITDGKEAGGIWFDDGEVYDVDGPFVKNVAKFYNDPEWKLYNDDGTVRVTDTVEAFEAAARPDVDPRYNNYVVEGQPEWVADKVTTYVIPVTPIFREEPLVFGGGGPGGPPRPDALNAHSHHGGEAHSHHHGPPRGGASRVGQGGIGLAFNGVNFDPPAPVHAILAAHTLAPFDDAGGHINPHEGYHYHAATGHTKEIAQTDGHAPMIGYALDGFGLYAHRDEEGEAATDLDECGGHTDTTRGYHYHVGSAGSNQIIRAFRGVPGTVSVKE
ncbi:YHYH protein [Rubritalea sp.]|uniref:YHYH protein n=1 Tax=Rubritalea sp. TaxID=2109375 RepID=UPI003EF3043A